MHFFLYFIILYLHIHISIDYTIANKNKFISYIIFHHKFYLNV